MMSGESQTGTRWCFRLSCWTFKVLFMATMTFEESGARTLYIRVFAVLAEDRVQFLALTLGSSQTPVIPPLEWPVASGLLRHCIHVHLPTHRHTNIHTSKEITPPGWFLIDRLDISLCSEVIKSSLSFIKSRSVLSRTDCWVISLK